MENAVEGLKIAFGVMMFVLALSVSISCFSNANSAVQSIVMLRDRETEYTYVNQSIGLTRKVGIETIIPTMYQAYKENIEIYFFKDENNDGNPEPLTLYYKTDTELGNRMQDENGDDIEINYINSAKEAYKNNEAAIEHLDIILGVGYDNYNTENATHKKYYKQFFYDKGIYNAFKDYEFIEELGEYEVGSGASKIKKRVITYTLCNDS